MDPDCLIHAVQVLHKRLLADGYSVSNCPQNDRVAVIVEPRRHPLFGPVIMNIMHHLGDGWNLHIFTSPINASWVVEQLPGWSPKVTMLQQDNLTTEEYSKLLMSKTFWQMINEPNILVFQTDAMLFRNGMNKWVGAYDYAGANYYNRDHTAPRVGGIQGGLSLRKKEAMLECIRRVSVAGIQAYRRRLGYKELPSVPEDVFFTHACEMLGMRVPSIERRREFAIEADYHPYTLGHHGLRFPYLTKEQQHELLTHP